MKYKKEKKLIYTLRTNPNPQKNALKHNNQNKNSRKNVIFSNLIILIDKYIIRYSDKLKVRWDIFVIILALYNCFVIPYNIAFIPGES